MKTLQGGKTCPTKLRCTCKTLKGQRCKKCRSPGSDKCTVHNTNACDERYDGYTGMESYTMPYASSYASPYASSYSDVTDAFFDRLTMGTTMDEQRRILNRIRSLQNVFPSMGSSVGSGTGSAMGSGMGSRPSFFEPTSSYRPPAPRPSASPASNLPPFGTMFPGGKPQTSSALPTLGVLGTGVLPPKPSASPANGLGNGLLQAVGNVTGNALNAVNNVVNTAANTVASVVPIVGPLVADAVRTGTSLVNEALEVNDIENLYPENIAASSKRRIETRDFTTTCEYNLRKYFPENKKYSQGEVIYAKSNAQQDLKMKRLNKSTDWYDLQMLEKFVALSQSDVEQCLLRANKFDFTLRPDYKSRAQKKAEAEKAKKASANLFAPATPKPPAGIFGFLGNAVRNMYNSEDDYEYGF